jgi:V8-like Glu-specific endopeptidase
MSRLFLSMLTCAALAGCSDPEVPNDSAPSLPSFHDVQDGSAIVRTAAEAVVLIATSGQSGTGVFISGDGTLLTNNHVLGAPVCPEEGCYVNLSFDYQRGATPAPSKLVFVVPFAVDLGLDIAAVHVLTGRDGVPFVPPSFLTLVSRSSRTLLGTHLTLIGHPEAGLKKWTDGVVVDATEEWIRTSAFGLPGDSGSPLIDDQGNMVAINHRGPNSQDLISQSGVNVFSIGSASAPVVQALAYPTLPPGMISLLADTTAESVVADNLVYRNAHVLTASIAGSQTDVLSLLGSACDAALARTDFTSIDDLDFALSPCFDASAWIECRVDQVATGGECPTDTNAWSARYDALNVLERDIGGGLELYYASRAHAPLASSKADGIAAAQTALQRALSQTPPPLDFYLAYYLGSVGIQSYQGVDLPSYTSAYAQVPGYNLQASYIAFLATWLNGNGWWTVDETLSVVRALYADPSVSIGAKLSIEQILYSWGGF